MTEHGSNLLTVTNDIKYEVDQGEKVSHYFYTIAKDYEHQFVQIQASVKHPLDGERTYYLDVHNATKDEISGLNLNQEALENIILLKIVLTMDSITEKQDFLTKAGKHSIEVKEYYKGRREPYPKQIHVFDKQKVELYESKYFLSVYLSESMRLTL